jgi:aspartyl-tRNA(Asn)/glutamyl-tRNA(Gln) amidotransferase subunit C
MESRPDLDIDKVAQLARLALTDEERTRFASQLSEILHHVEQLGKVDVSGIEPTAHAFPLNNVWAEDEPETGLQPEKALRNAPASRDGMFFVPRVVEE